MGFLHKIWDDTLAGPMPDSGLGRLRKYNSFSAATRSMVVPIPPPLDIPLPADDISITRSITVLRSPGTPSPRSSSGSPTSPFSPSCSSAPASPYSPSTPGGNFKKFTRRKPRIEAPSQDSGFREIIMQSAWDH